MDNNDAGLLNVKPGLNYKLIILILFAVGVYFLFPKIIGLQHTVKLMASANKLLILVAVCFEILSYVFALLGGLFYWLGDILCFYFVFLSFSYHISFGVLIFGYCISLIASMISLIPGGLGVTEGTMALIYSGIGVPSSIALICILVFRFFSFWIWIPIGFYSYITLKKR